MVIKDLRVDDVIWMIQVFILCALEPKGILVICQLRLLWKLDVCSGYFKESMSCLKRRAFCYLFMEIWIFEIGFISRKLCPSKYISTEGNPSTRDVAR